MRQHVAPVAVEDLLLRVDQPAGVGDGVAADGVGGHAGACNVRWMEAAAIEEHGRGSTTTSCSRTCRRPMTTTYAGALTAAWELQRDA